MHLLYEKQHPSIWTVTFNRSEVHNALNKALLSELKDFLENRALKEGIQVLILTGAGSKAFVAGADIKEISSMDYPSMLAFCRLGQSVANALETAPFVTIAAVNGFALGGGFEMALACDFIYATTQALFGLPEAKLGLIPGFGGTQRLTRAIGSRQAKELIFKGTPISAERGMELGFINSITEPEDLLESCLKTAHEILAQSFTAVVQAKKMINCEGALSLEEALDLESHTCALCSVSEESQKAISTFLGKKQQQSD